MAATRGVCSKIANILKNLILLYLFGGLLKYSQYVENLYGIYQSIWGLLLNMMGRSIFE
jgi:hypothetical protein